MSNGSFVLERFEHSNAMEILNGIMFDFYQGLAHILASLFAPLTAVTRAWNGSVSFVLLLHPRSRLTVD